MESAFKQYVMEEKPRMPSRKIVPPDGGWGWVVLLASFISYFIADGWSYSFGVVYPVLLEYFGEGRGKTAFISALLFGVPCLVSPVVCALAGAYGCRIVAMTGGALTGLAFILSSFATSIGYLCFSIGILASIGLAMIYIPSIVVVTVYFEKRRGLATGLAVTGSGLGAFAVPPLMEYLLQEYGWRQTLILFGGICFHVIPCGLLYRPAPTELVNEEENAGTASLKYSSENSYHVCKKSSNIVLPRMHENCDKRALSQPSLISSCQESHKKHDSVWQLTNTQVPNKLPSLENKQNEESIKLLQQDTPFTKCTKSSSCPDLYLLVSRPNAIVRYTENTTPHGSHYCEKFWFELKMLISSMLDKSLASSKSYMLYNAATFILYLFVGMPYVYLMDKSLLLGISVVKSAFLFSIIGIGRTVGQIVLGLLGDLPKVDTVLLYACSISVAGLGTLLVPVCLVYEALSFYSVVFGFFVSSTYSLQMMCLVEMVGLERATNAFGLFQLVQGISTVLGTPVAGWLYEATQSYDVSFYVAGVWILISGLMLLPLPIYKVCHISSSQETIILA